MQIQSNQTGIVGRMVLLAVLSLALFSFSWQPTLADGSGGSPPPPPPPTDTTGTGSSVDPGDINPGWSDTEPDEDLLAWDIGWLTIQVIR